VAAIGLVAHCGGFTLMTEVKILPETCERPDCQKAVETFCPLCEKFLCAEHDELVPVRRHACLGRPADV
jgi:hypothetical protein